MRIVKFIQFNSSGDETNSITTTPIQCQHYGMKAAEQKKKKTLTNRYKFAERIVPYSQSVFKFNDWLQSVEDYDRQRKMFILFDLILEPPQVFV